jgi:hypothetical protein
MPIRACLVLSLSLLAGTSCARQLPPLQSIELTGDPAVASKFEGRWYDDQEVLIFEVRRGQPSVLSFRLPGGFTLTDARCTGNEIHFSFLQGKVANAELLLRLTADDEAVLLRPGQEPSWCATCTPWFARLSAGELVAWKARRLGQMTLEVFEEACDTTIGWLADVL